jgi:hypothetical protein
MTGATTLSSRPRRTLSSLSHAIDPRRGNCVRSEAPMTRSTLFRRPEFPPIDGWAVADESSDEFRIAQIAELPQFLRRPRVLEQDLVNIKGIHLTTPEAVNR